MNVLMPQLGETVAEGKITVWFKAVGDTVKPGDNLFEIETDKTSMEVPATEAGVLSEIRIAAGETAPVGAVVAVIGDGGAAVAEATARNAAASVGAGLRPAPTSAKPASAFALAQAVQSSGGSPSATRGLRLRGDERMEPQRPSAPLDPFMAVRTPERNFGPARIGGVTVTPLARRLAGENGIDLARIKGSGPHGRIVAKDVEGAIGVRPAWSTEPPITAPGRMTAEQVKALYPDTPYEELPLDAMRRTIARRMTEAKQSVPHFYLTLDVALDAVLKLRDDANFSSATASGDPAFKLSVNDFVIKALALALQRVPAANAVWAEDRILRLKQSDMAVAVALDGGLLTPVIRAAERKTLSAISNEMHDLAGRARERKLAPGEYQGGASAISNLGMYGIREISAVINPPQSTILAVGAATRRPIETADGGVAFVTQMTVTLSCDHRVIDGALGAELLAEFKTLMESPVRMLV